MFCSFKKIDKCQSKVRAFIVTPQSKSFHLFLTTWPKKLATQLLWPNVSSLHFHFTPNFMKQF